MEPGSVTIPGVCNVELSCASLLSDAGPGTTAALASGPAQHSTGELAHPAAVLFLCSELQRAHFHVNHAGMGIAAALAVANCPEKEVLIGSCRDSSCNSGWQSGLLTS